MHMLPHSIGASCESTNLSPGHPSLDCFTYTSGYAPGSEGLSELYVPCAEIASGVVLLGQGGLAQASKK